MDIIKIRFSHRDVCLDDLSKKVILNKTISVDLSYLDFIMVRSPIPSVYAFLDVSGIEILSDANRILSLILFIQNKEKFTSDFFPEFNGFLFNELPRNIQRRILEFYIIVNYAESIEAKEFIKKRL